MLQVLQLCPLLQVDGFTVRGRGGEGLQSDDCVDQRLESWVLLDMLRVTNVCVELSPGPTSLIIITTLK